MRRNAGPKMKSGDTCGVTKNARPCPGKALLWSYQSGRSGGDWLCAERGK